jgi:hypothetical protein
MLRIECTRGPRKGVVTAWPVRSQLRPRIGAGLALSSPHKTALGHERPFFVPLGSSPGPWSNGHGSGRFGDASVSVHLAPRRFLCIEKCMRTQEKPKSGRGRPPGTRFAGNTPVRLEPNVQVAVDRWAERHAINRSEALRRLIALGLGVSQPPKARSAKARSKALDLAGKEIDKLIDPSAPVEERQQRKRRLLKGPREFREMRDEIRSKPKS